MLDAYIIKNGTLVSLLNGRERKADILVENGKISKISDHIEHSYAEIIDAEGKYVCIGWLDAHCHFGRTGNKGSVDVERDVLCQGVSYGVDMGTLGPDDYEAYRPMLLYRTGLRYKSFLYIGSLGIRSGRMDFEGPQDIEPEKVRRVAKQYHQEFLGLKARIDDKFCFDPEYVMNQLRRLGDELKMPVAVHAPRSRIGIDNLLPYLKSGDILCHTLAGNSDVMEVLDGNGNIRKSVLDAHERGVILDLSHGTNAYCYRTAEAAWKAGFFVDMISSDLHGGNLHGPVFNLGTVLTKIRGLTGQPWHWILKKTVVDPVRLLHITDKELEIKEGMTADLTVYEIEEGMFPLQDSRKEERVFRERIHACYTCVGSRVYTCRKNPEEE